MNTDYAKFDKLKERDRKDVFEATAERLGTIPQAIEKDLWVCRMIDAMFTGLSSRPKLFFKGGTSLSKGYGLIKRFSEDIDIVVSRPGLGIKAADDPLREGLSGKKREAAIERVKSTCSNYVLGRMKVDLNALVPQCVIDSDDEDRDKSTLLVKYPSILTRDGYLKPWVKIECGARGASEPEAKRQIAPYLQDELGTMFDLATRGVTLIAAERTFWEKALILHGIHCSFRDSQRRPGERNLISRHYYDVAMMCGCPAGQKAVQSIALLDKVREHKMLLFRNPREKLEESKPGTIRLLPQEEIKAELAKDFEEMSGMMFGRQPNFEWVLNEIAKLEININHR
jgi:Nucleotidyl transferase AbiEii toxin, Type IV TA system